MVTRAVVDREAICYNGDVCYDELDIMMQSDTRTIFTKVKVKEIDAFILEREREIGRASCRERV